MLLLINFNCLQGHKCMSVPYFSSQWLCCFLEFWRTNSDGNQSFLFGFVFFLKPPHTLLFTLCSGQITQNKKQVCVLKSCSLCSHIRAIKEWELMLHTQHQSRFPQRKWSVNPDQMRVVSGSPSCFELSVSMELLWLMRLCVVPASPVFLTSQTSLDLCSLHHSAGWAAAVPAHRSRSASSRQGGSSSGFPSSTAQSCDLVSPVVLILVLKVRISVVWGAPRWVSG